METSQTPCQHVGSYGLIINEDHVLLVQQIAGPYKEKWDLPGGKMEFGETPEETLKREVKEETGLEVLSSRLLSVETNRIEFTNNSGESFDVYHIGILFRAQVKLNEYQTEKTDLVYRWFTQQEILNLDTAVFVRRALVKFYD